MSKEQQWYEEIGYVYNPFTIKPGFFDDEVVGYDKIVDKMIKNLSNHGMYFLEGAYGQGKTTILKYLINEFKGQNRLIHISRNRSDRAMNYSKLLKGSRSGLGRLLGKPKNVILIVDETSRINREDCYQIEKLFHNDYFLSVLFMDKSFKEAKFSPGIKKLIGKGVLKLPSLKPENAVELVRSRLDGNKDLITNDLIKKVYAKSYKNTRQFLMNMEDVCRNAIEAGRKKVKIDDVRIL